MPDNKIEAPTVLVTDADRGSALAIIRSFRRKGWRVIAAASDRLSPGFYSRYADAWVRYPPPQTAAGDFVATLLRQVEANAVDLIIPVTEEVILLLGQERTAFEALCEIAMPAKAILQGTRDKAKTMALAKRLGVPVPRTFVAGTVEQALACAQELSRPIVLKPALSRRYDPLTGAIEEFSVSYANDLPTLERAMAFYEGRSSLLLQEYYEGEGQGVELLAWDGKALALFQHRRLCEIPVQGGASALRESVPLDPQLVTYAQRLTEALQWSGLLMIEFKVGQEGAKLMEINGRVWGSLPLAVTSGMDFPGLLADHYRGCMPQGDGAPNTTYRPGVRVANAEMLLMWILQVLWGRRTYEFLPFPARREALIMARHMLSPTLRYDILSLRDPLPALVTVLRLTRKFLCKIRMLR